jgi:hypothetical protein
MSWTIVNVTLPNDEAISGKSPSHKDLVRQILQDGFEPFSTAGIGNGIVISFRKATTDDALVEPGHWGQYA